MTNLQRMIRYLKADIQPAGEQRTELKRVDTGQKMMQLLDVEEHDRFTVSIKRS